MRPWTMNWEKVGIVRREDSIARCPRWLGWSSASDVSEFDDIEPTVTSGRPRKRADHGDAASSVET